MSEAERTIKRLAEIAEAFAWQAGVGGMETAGSIVSYLAAHPEHIETVLENGPLELPIGWHEQGLLTWHAMNGKIMTPRDARLMRQVKKLASPPNTLAERGR